MEVKTTRKIGGFLSIELMLVMTVMAILGSVTLYFGKGAVDKAKMFIMKLFDYYERTGEWPIATDNFVSVAEMELEVNGAFDNVFGVDGNPYSLHNPNREEIPHIWVRITPGLNRWGENALTELRRCTQRNVSENEIKYFDRVRYFYPKKSDRPRLQAEEEHIKTQNSDLDLEPVFG